MNQQTTYLEFDPEKLNRVAAICFYGRSGSYFLQSLLDHHPEIITVPEGHMMRFFFEFWNGCQNFTTAEELTARFVNDEFIKTVFDHGNGKEGGPAKVDPQQFRLLLNEILSKKNKISRKLFFQAVHLVYAHLTGLTPPPSGKPPIIVFQLHTPLPQRALGLVQDFPDTLFLHTIRNPIQSLGSHLAHYLRDVQSTGIEQVLWVLEGAIQNGVPIFEEYRKKSYAVKLEYLHTESKKILQKICELINIPWHDNLLKSTFNGQEWGLSSKKETIKGFNTTAISRKHEDLFSSFDRMRLSLLMKKKYQVWNYDFDESWYSYDEWMDAGMMGQLMKYPFRFEKLFYPNQQAFSDNRKILYRHFCKWCQVKLSEKNDEYKELTLLSI